MYAVHLPQTDGQKRNTVKTLSNFNSSFFYKYIYGYNSKYL